MKAVIVGNQNSGKSTLFNILTGSNQKIGNWPGVTVERKSGVIEDLQMEVVDLPGIYSLSPYSLEERISTGFLLNDEYDLIINVVDSTSLERGLFLTTQLIETNKNIIVVLNMMDKLEKKGISINIDNLKKYLGAEVCIVSSAQGKGIYNLIKLINKFKDKNNRVRNIKSLYNFSSERNIVERYNRIDQICKKCVIHKKTRKSINEFWDKIFLNKYLAIPIFILIMFFMYYISIEFFGKILSNYMSKIVIEFNNTTHDVLLNLNASAWLVSLICNGIITGVGSVISFLPQLFFVFLFTSFLEASGYMARVSFIFDKIFKKFGLCGKSLIPFILGAGCSVSGIMATKIIEDEKERINSIITTPFIPCSAKLPVITLFSKYFFEDNYALIATSFYFLSILVIIISSLIIKTMFGKGNSELYIFELPEYRLPSLKFIYRDVKEKLLDFIKKAGTVIFLASILVWFLLSFSTKFEYGIEVQDSILAYCGTKISWLFKPIIGVNSWQASISAIQGIIAKEQIISSMEIISGISGEFKNSIDIFNIGSPFSFFNKSSAYSFVAFNLFTTPCISAIISMYKELKSFKHFIFAVAYQLMNGYIVSVLLYNILKIAK